LTEAGVIFRFVRAAAIGFSILFVMIAFWATWFVFSKPMVIDFLAYWAAARLALAGQIMSVYDVAAHQAAEQVIAPINGWLPFAYPPPFLLIVAPFGVAPYWLAFALWVALTGVIYALVAGKRGALPYAMSHPAVLTNVLIGQNGFITGALFIGGLRTLRRNQLFGGAILGLLVIKPQLALLLPVAMIAGRRWNAIAGAIASSTVALLVALAAFGMTAYQGFFKILPFFTNAMAGGRWPWNEMVSVFGFLRYYGVSQDLALILHGIVALVAAALVAHSWWLDLEARDGILAAATLLVPPYLLTYDALLLVIPMLWLIERQRHLWVIPVAWLLCFLPIAGYFEYYNGPNTICLAALLYLWALHAPPATRRRTALSFG
jgi:alpha-1,2-mannosyltransferase